MANDSYPEKHFSFYKTIWNGTKMTRITRSIDVISLNPNMPLWHLGKKKKRLINISNESNLLIEIKK
jgi:hypothetical protein